MFTKKYNNCCIAEKTLLIEICIKMNMKKLLLFLAATLVLIIVGCSSSITTPDNTILLKESFRVPKGFDGAREQKYVIKKVIKEIGAEYTFEISTFQKDTSKTALKSLEIILNKGVKNYEFHAQTSTTQSHSKGNNNLFTFANVSVIYSTEDLGQKGEWKNYTINSLGEINDL